MKQTTRSIVRASLAFGAGSAILAAAPAASAQQRSDFGQQGQFIISADRLFSLFSFDDVSQDDLFIGGLPANVSSESTTTTSTAMSFFRGGNAGATADAFFTAPRLGLDYVIVPNVTVGGDVVALFTLGGSSTRETDYTNGSSQTATTTNPGQTGFGIAPRGGYVLGLNNMFSLWLRGGFSFYTASTKTTAVVGAETTTTTDNTNQFALDLEPQLVFTPVPHVGFTAGLDADIPLAGGHSEDVTTGGNSQSVSAHSSIFYLGVELGMLAHF